MTTPVFCNKDTTAMPGRISNGECKFVPLSMEYETSPHLGTYQSSEKTFKDLELGQLTDPDSATFRSCFSYGNYQHSFYYKPVWPIVTIYDGQVIVGSAFWFDRGFIIIDDDVIPVNKFKIFCAERP